MVTVGYVERLCRFVDLFLVSFLTRVILFVLLCSESSDSLLF